MDQIDASKPMNITVDDNAIPWYLQAVRELAQAEIAESFDALTAIQIPHFEQFDQLRKDGRHGYNGISGCLKGTLMMMLVVGVYDGPLNGRQVGGKPPVYAFIHRAKMNQVGYCYKLDDSTFDRLGTYNMHHVDFVEPFCDLRGSSSTVVRLLKSVVLYYFLSAAHITEINGYKTFWPDFKQACGWIANKGSLPRPQIFQNRADGTPEDVTDAKFVASLSPQLHAAVDDTATSGMKRQRQEEPEESDIKLHNHAQLARQVHGNITRSSSPDEPLMIRSLKTRIKSFKDANALLRTQNNQLTAEKSEQQAQIDYLTAEAARLEEHRAYVRNAYDGLKHKHDQLATENLKAMARVLAAENKAKESAANAAMWQIRAERAEQQIIDVKTEHDSLLTKIREHIRAVGNELFDLSDKV